MTAAIDPARAPWLLVAIAAFGAVALLMLLGLYAEDYLRRRRPAGWTLAARQLGQRDAILAAEVQQLEGHVSHLGAEVERLRHQLAQAAARPPSDPTVRLGPAYGRTARMGRLDPTPNGSAR